MMSIDEPSKFLKKRIEKLIECFCLLCKSLRTYKQRRDAFCTMLQSELGNVLNFFDLPEGGMAVWAKFDPAIDLVCVSKRASQKDLYFSEGKVHDSKFSNLNTTRLGFASSTIEELERCIAIFKASIK